MIHIVFQEADIEVLKQAIELDPQLAGEIEIIRDDYAVGPLQNIYETEGYQNRREWWKQLLEASPYDTDQLMNLVDDRMAVHNLKKSLEDNTREVVWIWMGQNQHDVCGYYWLISQLKEYQGRVYVLYMNNLPFINEKGHIFYPAALHQIQPKEFLKAKKLNRAVTLSEFEVDPDEWTRIINENSVIRLLEGGKKIVSAPDDFYDKDILQNIPNDWQKGNRVMSNVLAKMKIKTGDVFLLWRMKQLAAEEKMEIQGDPAKGWKEFEVKIKSENPIEVPLSSE